MVVVASEGGAAGKSRDPRVRGDDKGGRRWRRKCLFIFAGLLLLSASTFAQPLRLATETVRVLLAADAPVLTLRVEGLLRLKSGDATRELPAGDRKSTRLNSSHIQKSRMPSSA